MDALVTNCSGVYTEASANPLASRREGERLPDSHLPNVEVMLTDVRSCPLWHKLLHPMPVVGHLAWNLHIIFMIIPSQNEFAYLY